MLHLEAKLLRLAYRKMDIPHSVLLPESRQMLQPRR